MVGGGGGGCLLLIMTQVGLRSKLQCNVYDWSVGFQPSCAILVHVISQAEGY